MKLLILGGTGAMGTHLVRILSQQGHNITVTSRNAGKSENHNVRFLTGNAHDIYFLEDCLSGHPDAVIDFMNYKSAEFQTRYERILNHTGQYVFLSSARVYAASETPVTEESPRLLDVSPDKFYLSQEEYALEKAREENFLLSSGRHNWIIIRPYITYSDERLQLGILEKEGWLYRALHKRTIVFSKDVMRKTTTLTYGADVALRIAHLIGKEKASGEIFQLAAPCSVTWENVLRIYTETLEHCTGIKPSVFLLENGDGYASRLGADYQLHYDRLYDRVFDSTKAETFLNLSTPYRHPAEGLAKCLKNFVSGSQNFRRPNWKLEAYFDRLTKQKTSLAEILEWKQKLKYFIYRIIKS